MSNETIHQKVSEQIAAINPVIEDKVVGALVTREANKRADAILKGIDKLSDLSRERRKTDKGDTVTYNKDGTVASELYSKERIEANKKADDAISKLTAAVNKALNGDCGDLYNLVK